LTDDKSSIIICIMVQTCKNTNKTKKPDCCAGLGELMDAKFFKALCDPRRLAILARLAGMCEPCTVTGIAACCPTDLSVVSRHLAILREAGILEAEKRGKEVYYSVRYPVLVNTLRALADGIEACCVKK
jgi:ArsR family transcriptional regulator, arsenate/arsenite/antimonite-responsive transcriptional repressor